MRLIAAFLLTIIIHGFSFGQKNISGLVTDESNNPLPFVNVILMSSSDSTFVKGTISENDGDFVLENIATDSYFLELSMIGYQTLNSEIIDLDIAAKPTEFNFQLLSESEILDEITVVAKKPLFEQRLDRTIINVENSIVSSGSDVLSILERSPGVAVDRLNNQIRMQGKQGVIVMLDEKVMRMEMLGLIQLLQSMSSDNIITIELITTPPASFDAEGSAGVINIITKKIKTEGTNLNVNMNIGYGIKPKVGGGLVFNHKKGKWNWYGDGSVSYDRSQHDAFILRKNVYQGVTTTTDLENIRPPNFTLYNYRFGTDVELNSRTTIGGLFSGYTSIWRMDATSTATVNNSNNTNFTSFITQSEENIWNHYAANLYSNFKISGNSSLTINYDHLYFEDNNPTDYTEKIVAADKAILEENTFISRKRTPISFHVVKLDYNLELIKQWQLEIGLKGALTSFGNDLQLADLVNDQWVDDLRFTDNYELDEKLSAAYSSLSYENENGFSAKAGLRYEYYDSDLISTKEGSILVQKYGRFFPTFNLKYQWSTSQNIQLSYSERITRPGLQDIASAFYLWGYNTILGGNPSLLPTFSKQLQMGYRLNTALFQMQYTYSDNPFTGQPVIDPESNIVATTITNMKHAHQANLSINLPINFTSWWESRYNAAAYWQELVPIFEGRTLKIRNTYFTFNSTQTFKLPKAYSFEISGNLRTPMSFGIGQMAMRGSFNLGLKKQFSDRLNLTLTWDDPFNLGSVYIANYEQPELNILYNWKYDVEGSILRINASYRFGKTGLKNNKERKTGADEERGRVN